VRVVDVDELGRWDEGEDVDGLGGALYTIRVRSENLSVSIYDAYRKIRERSVLFLFFL
jgi:hypothetical protein